MNFPILITRTSPFPLSGVLGGIFHFYSNFNGIFCTKQTVKILIRHRNNAVSDLNLHCFPTLHIKQDARLIWAKSYM